MRPLTLPHRRTLFTQPPAHAGINLIPTPRAGAHSFYRLMAATGASPGISFPNTGEYHVAHH
ncbi:protein of unknown function [Acidithiobacillus ferrivorans]|uniref:Uncharacterized protein n=1 Tax=Acidithiobacillus ferrivorans TaxID=160808 RepID=A0ABY1MMC1_9PROT|nr:protein of unknown function [Acidithiobacillus ferrivorans]